jgi:protein-tyrosine-phosphatase
MKTVLNDRQKIVLECVYKQYSARQSLDYLKQEGFDISEKTLARDKKFIKTNSLVRLYQMAKIDFRSYHQERKEELELIKSEMWKNYNEIKDPYKKIMASERIANLIPIISAYEDAAQYVIEKSNTNKQEPIQTLSI